MLGVVLLGSCLVSNPQVEGDELESLALDAGDNFADVAVLDAVRLDQNECTFSHGAQLY